MKKFLLGLVLLVGASFQSKAIIGHASYPTCTDLACGNIYIYYEVEDQYHNWYYTNPILVPANPGGGCIPNLLVSLNWNSYFSIGSNYQGGVAPAANHEFTLIRRAFLTEDPSCPGAAITSAAGPGSSIYSASVNPTSCSNCSTSLYMLIEDISPYWNIPYNTVQIFDITQIWGN